MSPTFFQICTSNENIGLGHVIRCLAFYVELKNRDISVKYIYVGDSKKAILLIKNKVFKEDLYLEKNFKKISRIINLGSIIVFDFPDQYFINFSKKIRSKNLLVAFDFFKDLNFKNQLYFNVVPNLVKDNSIKNSSYFEGPKYALIRTVFKKNRLKKINKKIKNILISFGGSDPKSYTEIFLKIIPELINNDYKIDCILPRQREIRISKLNTLNNLNIYHKFVKIDEIASSVDLVICSGGGTLWEMCCLGVPILAIPQTPSELKAVKYLEKNDACFKLKNSMLNKENVVTIINNLSINKITRETMSNNGKRIVDGLGLQRVIDTTVKRYRLINDKK